MEEEPIGSREAKAYRLPEPLPEHPTDPEPSAQNTNFWEASVKRKEMAYSLTSLFVALLLIQIGYGQKETHDIASVRAENKANSEAIISEIRANDKAARERSAANMERQSLMSAALSQNTGKIDALIKALESQGRQP